jgi:sporulation protein YlmC with PRC-barrel domain
MSSKSFRKEEIEGKTVIETSGKVGGKVKDLTFSLDGTITLIVVKEDGSEVQIPLRQVVGISDHVIVRSEGATSQGFGTKAPSANGACKYCGAPLPAGTSWCVACGRAQT